MRRNRAMAAAAWLALFTPAACAGRATPAATTPCQIAVEGGGQLDFACLPAISADGGRVAVPERCDDRGGPPCLAIVLMSPDGEVRERIEVAKRSVIDARLERVNLLLADGRFAPMRALELPFSAYDLDVMHLRTSGVVIHYGEGTLLVDRNDERLARLDLPAVRGCTGPWIRSLFLDERTHTLAARDRISRADGPGSGPPRGECCGWPSNREHVS